MALQTLRSGRLLKKRKRISVDITILGLMGPKTERAIVNVEESVAGARSDIGVECISDPIELCRLGPVQTPSVYVNGELRCAGRIPSVHDVRLWIDEEISETSEYAEPFVRQQ